MYGRETWSLTLREDHRLIVCEKKVLRKIFEVRMGEAMEGQRKLNNKEIRKLHSIIRTIQSRKLGWAQRIA
jgi:hypothetical protein